MENAFSPGLKSYYWRLTLVKTEKDSGIWKWFDINGILRLVVLEKVIQKSVILERKYITRQQS